MAVWTRGLMPMPHGLVPPARERGSFRWVLQPVDGRVTGTIYTDGSMVDGPPYLDGICRRLAWAFVALDRHGMVTASAHGAPSAWVESIYGAELWALMMAALHATCGSALRTDCLSVLQVFRSGPSAANSGK